uniref:Uncharacterized protein n=1 Tax=Brassica oleracea var. oleracea TaxID=109376 RepID=A0A0D3DA91_BRAOL
MTSHMQHIPQRIHRLWEGISVRPITIDQKTITSKVTDIGPIFSAHNFSPQNYKHLLRLATTPTYLPGINTDATIGLRLNSHSLSKLERLEHPVTKSDGSLNILVVGDWGRQGGFNQSLVAHQIY